MTAPINDSRESAFRFQKRKRQYRYSYTDPFSEKTENKMKEKKDKEQLTSHLPQQSLTIWIIEHRN
jgi:hypothetical protein